MRCRKMYSKGYAQIHFAPRVTKFPIIYSVNFPSYITNFLRRFSSNQFPHFESVFDAKQIARYDIITCLHVTTMGTSVCEILQIKPLTSDTLIIRKSILISTTGYTFQYKLFGEGNGELFRHNTFFNYACMHRFN